MPHDRASVLYYRVTRTLYFYKQLTDVKKGSYADDTGVLAVSKSRDLAKRLLRNCTNKIVDYYQHHGITKIFIKHN